MAVAAEAALIQLQGLGILALLAECRPFGPKTVSATVPVAVVVERGQVQLMDWGVLVEGRSVVPVVLILMLMLEVA